MKKLMVLALCTLGLAACKGRSGNPVANVREAAADRDLQNTFQSDCFNQFPRGWIATKGEASVKSYRTQFDFKGENITRKTIYYLGGDCTGDAVEYQERGTYTVDKSKGGPTNGYNIDFHFKKLIAKASSPDGAKVANALEWCSRTDWSQDEKDVTDKSADLTCYGAPLPRDVYNVYRVDNGVLRLGADDLSANKAETRPSSLKTGNYSRK